MSLNEKIKTDLVSAMKSHDTFKVSVLRMLKSELQLESINLKKELTDDEIMAVIKRNVKKRKDAIEEFKKYEKTEGISEKEQSEQKEEIEKNNTEITILESYLPAQLSEEEIENAVVDAINELKPESIKDMGRVMKHLTLKIGTVADMGKVSYLVKSKLTSN